MNFSHKTFFGLLLVLAVTGCRTTKPQSSVDIVGGEVVAPGERIAQVTVLLLDAQNRMVCSGTLIADDMVLSAAHCPEPAKIAFGAYVEPGQVIAEQTRPVITSWANPCFEFADVAGNRYGFDVRVIRFDGQVPAGFGPPVELVPDSLAVPLETVVIAAGFGKTNEASGMDGRLRRVEQSIKTDGGYSNMLIHMTGGPGRVLDKSLCQGDSGGPTFIEHEGKLKLLGVNSHGVGDLHQGLCRDGSAIVDLRAKGAWLAKVTTAMRTASPLDDEASASACTNPTDDSKSLSAYNDDVRGFGACRIYIHADPSLSHLTSAVSYHDPQCDDREAASNVPFALAPTSENVTVMLLEVSSPKSDRQAYLCDDDSLAAQTCAEKGVLLPARPDYDGKGRRCFRYELQAQDVGRKGRVVMLDTDGSYEVVKGAGFDGYLELGYMPCPPPGGI